VSEAQKHDLFFAADVEADGPVPGRYSMLSFALVVAGTFDGERFVAERAPASFEAKLRPVSETFDPESLAVSGLSRAELLRTGRDPSEAMRACAAWVTELSRGRTPVLVAYPLGFDWSFLAYYFAVYGAGSPFLHSRAFDVKTMVALHTRVPVGGAGRSKLPPRLVPELPHTHDALADARSLAELVARLFADQKENPREHASQP